MAAHPLPSPSSHLPSSSSLVQQREQAPFSPGAELLPVPTSSIADGPCELSAPRAPNHGAMSLHSPIHGAQLLGPIELLPPMALSSPTAPYRCSLKSGHGGYRFFLLFTWLEVEEDLPVPMTSGPKAIGKNTQSCRFVLFLQIFISRVLGLLKS